MKSLLASALLLAGALAAQPAMPAWLAPYPETTPQTKSFPAYIESTYTTPAAPAAILEHYRKLFATAGVGFAPGSDGIGAIVRAAAAECDLLLSIRAQTAGTLVRVSCAAKSPAYATEVASTTITTTTAGRPGTPRRLQPPPPAPSAADMMERHKKLVAELNIHPVYQDAPAPPLVWPTWLVHLQGARLAIQKGVDPAGNDYLRSRFTTGAPMTAIFTFYEDLLNANDYHVYSSKLGTGQTISGITQNADGYVEGANYPNGHPGPWTVIRVDFSRFHLNDPIKVDIRFTTYPFQAPKR